MSARALLEATTTTLSPTAAPLPFGLSVNDADSMWLLIGAILVFFMQAGFAMLEVGSINIKNTKNILIKNVFDASIGAICWWLLGWGFAFGGSAQGFIGGFGDDDAPPFTALGTAGYGDAMWLFQWAFAGAAATIVSGAVAERVTFTAYIVYSVCLTSFIYPPMVHMGWTSGAFSAWRSSDLMFDCGLTDFAGSGVVHMTGGVAALVGATVVGPRTGRFAEDGSVRAMPQQSVIFQTLGTLILWMGWYGFNGVSTLYIQNYSGVAAHTMVTTTIAAATGCLVCTLIGYGMNHTIDPADANNGILAGLVSITAPCSTCSNAGAFIIGTIGAAIYFFSAKLLIKLKIDDVVNAVPVHGCCGCWGVIAAGLFATPHLYSMAYYSSRADDCAGLFYGGNGSMFMANICFILVVLAWVGTTCTIMFMALKVTVGVRVPLEMEEEGMDSSKHGGIVEIPTIQADTKLTVKGAEA